MGRSHKKPSRTPCCRLAAAECWCRPSRALSWSPTAPGSRVGEPVSPQHPANRLSPVYSLLDLVNSLNRIVRELIKHGAPVNLADRDGVSPLAAVFAYPNSYCPYHPPLHYWAFDEVPFLAHGMSRDQTSPCSFDPSLGCCAAMTACAASLLEHGAEVNQVAMDGSDPWSRLFTALCFRRSFVGRHELVSWITQENMAQMAALLLQAGADPRRSVTLPDRSITLPERPTAPRRPDMLRWPLTALEHAFWDADVETCTILLGAGVEPSQETITWMIQIMMEEGFSDEDDAEAALEVVKHLLTAGNRVTDPKYPALRSPLCLSFALQRGYVSTWSPFFPV